MATSITADAQFAPDSSLEERDSNHRSRSNGTASPGFSRPAAPRCQRQQGPENVMHASYQGIARDVAASSTSLVRRLMAPAGIDGGDEAVRNRAAQDDLFAALLYQHPLAC
jgi:hypothetical protein